jgi:type I restriction enzyme S subunit
MRKNHFYELLIEGGRCPQPGDLIFSRNATVGEVAQVHADHPRFAMGQDVVLLRKLSPEYSSDYLQHVIRSPIIIQQLANMMIGSTFKRINVEEIRSFMIPSPPPKEQAQISEYLEGELSKFDTLTAEAQRAIDLLQERRTALISAAVTGQIDVRNF